MQYGMQGGGVLSSVLSVHGVRWECYVRYQSPPIITRKRGGLIVVDFGSDNIRSNF